jgi:molecular chaperone GrpE
MKYFKFLEQFMEKDKQKKHQKKDSPDELQKANKNDTPDSSPENDEQQVMVSLTYEDYDQLEKQLEALRAEVEEQKDGWLRTRADFENYKKRVQRDASRSYQDAMSSVLKLFLTVSDDLERAIKNKPEEDQIEGWINGIKLIDQKLMNQMKNLGVERLIIKPGEVFDPNIHEAITQEENPDFEEGQIIDVVQPGYKISDRIIRPAMVRVAK